MSFVEQTIPENEEITADFMRTLVANVDFLREKLIVIPENAVGKAGAGGNGVDFDLLSNGAILYRGERGIEVLVPPSTGTHVLMLKDGYPTWVSEREYNKIQARVEIALRG